MFFSKKIRGDDLRQLRANAGIKKKVLVEALGISHTTLNKWENAESDVPMTLTQFEIFLYAISAPGEMQAVNDAFNELTELWVHKVQN